ncbi:hypothetical protein [Kitasatospora camelliae]|uniref:Uncharacterized protein n=1 Tax=Kitasatospora camelliae TaxID=3156397 RepID=A0AAU8JRZ9_9ACTN
MTSNCAAGGRARAPGGPASWRHRRGSFVGLPFGTAWYRATGGAARAWCRLARRSCRILAGTVHGVLTVLASVLFWLLPPTAWRDGGPGGQP